MALLRSGSETREWEHYRLDDYEEKKRAYLRAAAEEAAEPDAPAAHAGTLEEQLVQTNLW